MVKCGWWIYTGWKSKYLGRNLPPVVSRLGHKNIFGDYFLKNSLVTMRCEDVPEPDCVGNEQKTVHGTILETSWHNLCW